MNVHSDSFGSKEPNPKRLTAQELVHIIEDGRQAAEDFRHDEAVEKFMLAAASPVLTIEQRTKVRCVLAESLEFLARYREALAVLADYETSAGRAGLSPAALTQVWLRLGSLHGYNGDAPRAISYLKSALALAEERHDNEDLGMSHMIMGRIYRAIGETQFARDHLNIALRFHRQVGHWIPLAQTYFLLGNVNVSEGEMGIAREHFEQAIKIIGDRRAPLLLGSIYTSLSNLILLQEYGQAKEGVQTLEKAIHFLKEAKNDRLLAYAYSNLGFVLKNIGEWKRAYQALQFAIEVGRLVENKVVQATAQDTLGELYMLQGNVTDAAKILHEAIQKFQAANFPYGEVQAVQTLGRCYLAQGQYADAIRAFENQLLIAQRLEDKRSYCSAKLYLAQTFVALGNLPEAEKFLIQIAEDVDDSANVSLVGHFRIVSGMMNFTHQKYEEARHDLGQAITIFFMVADRYRESSARYELSKVYSARGEIDKARTELKLAHDIAAQLGALPLLQKIRVNIPALELAPAVAVPPKQFDALALGTLNHALVLRLIRAASSRELLVNELTHLLQEITHCSFVAAFDATEKAIHTLAVAGGDVGRAAFVKSQQALRIIEAGSDLGTAMNTVTGETIYRLRGGSETLVVYLIAGQRGKINRDVIEPLLRLAEMGLALNAKREKPKVEQEQDENNGKNSPTRGFIFASPAMRVLVNDIHKIRGSRVTALITGESGTGKEVVARLIHNLSDRRTHPFVAFNCTIAAPDIVNSQLFGHKKGAFTGATTDTTGVIRSADGGTLFLDEIGDLALDVQPKLLRFLQEGEIHRLGENAPTRVDVRVIAATNADLEKLVAEGKFREDLYYRLNVIRFPLPPLRERREEIPLLIDYYLRLYSEQSSKTDITVNPHTMDLLMIYDWPGNVRQLANEVQRLVAYKDSGEEITERDLSPLIYSARISRDAEVKSLGAVTEALRQTPNIPIPEYPVQLNYRPGQQTLGDLVDELERQIILEAMRRHNGKRNAVCEELGITRKGLYLKLRRLPGIDLTEF